MKRLLQYSQSKKQNNHALFRSLASRSRAHLPSSSLLISSLYTRAYCISYALGYACSSLVPRPSSLLLGMSVSLMPMHLWLACIHYMHALYLMLPLPYTLPYCTCTLLISCFVALCTYFISYITLLFCTCTAYF